MHFLLNGSPYLIQSGYLQPLHEIWIDPEIVPGIGGFWLKILANAKEIVFPHELEYTFMVHRITTIPEFGGYPSVSVCGELHGDPLYFVPNVHVRYGVHLSGLRPEPLIEPASAYAQ